MIAEGQADQALHSHVLADSAVQASFDSEFEVASTLADEAVSRAAMSGDRWAIAMAAWAPRDAALTGAWAAGGWGPPERSRGEHDARTSRQRGTRSARP
jgi:hypothetical protein